MLPSIASTNRSRKDDVERLQGELKRMPSPRKSQPAAPCSASKKSVIMQNNPNDPLPCPECGTAFDSDTELKLHVFQCRIDHNVDPMLRLTVIRRSPRKSPRTTSSQSPRRHVPSKPVDDLEALMRPINSGFETSVIFSGRVPQTARSGTAPHSSRSSAKNVWSKTLSTMGSHSHEPVPPVCRSTRNSRAKRHIVSQRSQDTDHSPVAPSASGGKFVVSRGVSAEEPIEKRSPERNPKFHQALSDMLKNLCEDDQTDLGSELDISGMELQEQQVAVLRSLLVPGPAALPITSLNIERSTHANDMCISQTINALQRNNTLITLLTGGSDIDEFQEMGKIKKRIAARKKQKQAEIQESDFAGMVEHFQDWEEEKSRKHQKLMEHHRTTRQTILSEEVEERRKLGNNAVQVLNKLIQKVNRREVKKAKEEERQMLAEDEKTDRALLSEWAVDSFLSMFEQVEQERRRVFMTQFDEFRLSFRFVEREDIFRAKIREMERKDYEQMQRQSLSEELELLLEITLRQRQAALELIKLQERRHYSQELLRQKARQEIKSFDDYAEKAMKAIVNEAMHFWQTNFEKLRKALEIIEQRVAAQHDALFVMESDRRSTAESAFAKWSNLATDKFFHEMRLIQVRQRCAARNERRRELMRETPVVSLLNGKDAKPRMYCTSTVGHSPSEPILILPEDVSVTIGMRPDWAQQLQESEHKCKASVIEERSAMTEALYFVSKHEKDLCESHDVSVAPNEEIDLKPIIAITRAPPRETQPAQQQSNSTKKDAKETAVIIEASEDDLTQSQSQTLTKRRSMRRKQSKQDEPLAPPDPDCEYYKRAKKVILAQRSAWYDKVHSNTVKNHKETIKGGKITLSLAGDDEMRTQERILTTVKYFDYLIDHEPPVFDEEPIAVPVIGLETSKGGIEEHEDDNVSESSEDEKKKPKPLPLAKECIEIELVKRPPTENNAGNEDSQMSSMESSSTSYNSSDGSEKEESSANFDYAIAPKDLTDALQSISYKNLTSGDQMTADGTGLRQIKVKIEIDFQVKDRYCQHESGDAFGYFPLPPPENEQIQTIVFETMLFVALTPSSFKLVDDTAPNERTLVEGKNIDRVDVFQKCIRGIENPWKLRQRNAADVKDGECAWELVPPSENEGYKGGRVRFEVDGEGASEADRLSVLDEMPALSFSLAPRTVNADVIKVHNQIIASCCGGILQSTMNVNTKNHPNVQPFAEFLLQNDSDKDIAGEAIIAFIHQLRYHNTVEGPEEGERIVRVSLISPDGGVSVLEAAFDVEPEDKPTELKIVHPKITYRAASHVISNALKPFVQHTYCPVAPGCLVEDEDTDRFSGGGMTVTLTTPAKGDALVLVPSIHLVYPSTPPNTPDQICVRPDGAIIYEERVVATITEGQVVQDDGHEPEFDAQVFSCDFAQDDDCSIMAVQTILRHIALVNTAAPHNFKAHSQAARDIDIHIQIMDNEQQCMIDENTLVKGAGHSIQVAEKGTTFDYRQNMGMVKLGNFDISNDRINPLQGFATGFLYIKVIEGCEADNITLKADDSEYKLVEFGTKGKKGKSKLKAAAHVLGHKKNLADVAKEKKLSTKQEIIFYGMKEPMASVDRLSDGLLICFYPDTKKDQITRRQVGPLLRNLMYSCESANPSQKNKIIRIMCSDHIASTPSQCLVNINIEVSDEVTQIKLKNDKQSYVQTPGHTLALLPLGRSQLVDKDTEFFDGGYFDISCTAGATKGDSFAFVPPHKQFNMQRSLPPVEGFSSELMESVSVSSDGSTILHDDVVVATCTTSQKDGGINEFRITFAKGEKGHKVVPINLASYMMNSICFSNNFEKLKDFNRTYELKIKDIANAEEGKHKLTLRVSPPHLNFSYGPNTTFEQFFESRRHIPAAATAKCVSLLKNLVVNMEKFNPPSTSPMPPLFTLGISGEQADKVCLKFLGESIGVSTRDGKLYQGKDVLCRLVEESPQKIVLQFDPNCNTRVMNKTMLQTMLRAISLEVVSNLETTSRSQPPPLELDAEVAQSILSPPGGEGQTESFEGDDSKAEEKEKKSASETPVGQDLFVQGSPNETSRKNLSRTPSAKGSRRGSRRLSKSPMTPTMSALVAVPDDNGTHVLFAKLSLSDGENLSQAILKLVPTGATFEE